MADNDDTCESCAGMGDYTYGVGALNPDGWVKPCPDCGGSGKK